MLREYTFKIPASSSEEFAIDGNYIRVKDAAVAVRLEAPDNNESTTLQEGDAVTLSPFNRVRFAHDEGTEQTITVLIGQGVREDSARIGGSIIANPTQSGGTYAHGPVTVTNASTTIAAANANRRYLLIQNRDPVGTIYINITDAVATVGAGGNGIEIPPGGKYESNSAWVSTAAIRAIGTIASNANVLLVEGN